MTSVGYYNSSGLINIRGIFLSKIRLKCNMSQKRYDIIYEIDGESAYDLDLDEIVRRIKGPEGTTVKGVVYGKV